jgi:hypothetical protein
LVKASELKKGTKVKNLQNEGIGDVHEILIEPVAVQMRLAVLSVGGFLGIGDTKVAVPWQALQVTKEGDKPKLLLDGTKERLQNAPRVEGEIYDRLYAMETAEPVYVFLYNIYTSIVKHRGNILNGANTSRPSIIKGRTTRERTRTRSSGIKPAENAFLGERSGQGGRRRARHGFT